jgi:hypothetical protein
LTQGPTAMKTSGKQYRAWRLGTLTGERPTCAPRSWLGHAG